MEVKRKRKPTLGVIGGSGPEAGLNVVEKMLFIHKVGMGETYMSDKDAVSIILMQDPGIGGPHGTWDLGDPNDEAFLKLWEKVTCLIRKLDAIDVDYFCIACNTLHVLESKIRKWMIEENVTAHFVSIVESTKTAIVRNYNENILKPSPEYRIPSNENYKPLIDSSFVRSNIGKGKGGKNRIAILGSLITCDITGSSPYKALFDESDLECVIIEEEKRKQIQCLISETKRRGPSSDLQNKFSSFVNERFVDEFNTRTDYIVLACTELPLLLSQKERNKLESLGIITIDPNFVLAEEMLRVGGYLS